METLEELGRLGDSAVCAYVYGVGFDVYQWYNRLLNGCRYFYNIILPFLSMTLHHPQHHYYIITLITILYSIAECIS